MKKKVITALLITMTLTLGGVGTAYAMNNDMAILSGEAVNDVNMIKEGFIWVVDKESWTETIHHEAVTEKQWVVDKEAWTEEIKHPAVVENKWVVDKEAWTETIKHKEEGHFEIKHVCHGCDFIITSDEAWVAHSKSTGHMSFGTKEVWVVDKEAWTETINHPEEGHYEEVEVKPAWTETIKHPEKGHYEEVEVKPAWTETITHPEEGHWEPVKDEEKPEKPEQKPDEEKPETPEQKPDEEKPETPEQKPDEETPENPEQKPDEQTPENPEQKPDEQTPDTQKPEVKPEQEKDDIQKAPEQESKKEDTNTAPKTGDPTNLAYLATLAGSALVGGVSWKFRKRK